ncbi:[LysW]-aminoadipate/[LysW]-glutamate kinase [Pyrococcus abyssi]|uniref:Putative [LysW]-aminoadipate/[LysW]-glutamate kinase n=1 Tax=Pyrococcus abyssi (strain GE5 / Orsay) TaxID=272844 RepID=LYSZ_PYRAB|nr:[LysW]-aminoadipate/[LysW]-glutamate kinase [Pyrococcus abyssi]Q9V1I5.2 RecName: Full=Putative [LysW]-aminoadipate/[LysW]-glutamate kinase [Pyrococcus abyssi GE5]CCE69824.1 TPA: acetylglutamate kinase [Pyrococcus abyssi GE5]
MRVIKVGGSVVPMLDKILDTSSLHGNSIIVHGGSRYVDEMARKLGVKVERLVSPSGVMFRRTTRRVLDVYVAALMRANRELVSFLRERGIDAIGVSGLDGVVLAKRKKLVKAVVNGKVIAIRDDYSGVIKSINVTLLKNYLKVGIPVIASIAYDPEENVPLNVDGDKVAYHVAIAMKAKELRFLSDTAFLIDGNVVERIPLEDFDEYLRYAGGGMKKKLMMARKALESGVKKVVIEGLNGRTVIS